MKALLTVWGRVLLCFVFGGDVSVQAWLAVFTDAVDVKVDSRCPRHVHSASQQCVIAAEECWGRRQKHRIPARTPPLGTQM